MAADNIQIYTPSEEGVSSSSDIQWCIDRMDTRFNLNTFRGSPVASYVLRASVDSLRLLSVRALCENIPECTAHAFHFVLHIDWPNRNLFKKDADKSELNAFLIYSNMLMQYPSLFKYFTDLVLPDDLDCMQTRLEPRHPDAQHYRSFMIRSDLVNVRRKKPASTIEEVDEEPQMKK